MPLPARLAFAALATAALAGCSPSSPPPATPATAAPKAAVEHAGHGHDHADHDHPQTLAAGLAELAAATAAVKEHLAADARDAADDAVHAMGHLLEDVQGLVRTSDLAAEAKASATKALDDLFDCFDKLDTALHAEPGKGESPAEVHASIADRVEAAIATLRAAAAAAPAAAVTDGNDDAAAIIRDANATGEDR